MLVRLVVKEIDNMGHTRVVVKCDNEPATKVLAGRIGELRIHCTAVEQSPTVDRD